MNTNRCVRLGRKRSGLACFYHREINSEAGKIMLLRIEYAEKMSLSKVGRAVTIDCLRSTLEDSVKRVEQPFQLKLYGTTMATCLPLSEAQSASHHSVKF